MQAAGEGARGLAVRWGGGLARTLAAAAGAWAARSVTQRWVPRAARQMERVGLVRRNWAGRPLPTAVGVVPAAVGLAGLAALGRSAVAASSAVAGLGGWIDDVAGRPQPKGWRGHLQASLRDGRPTTGTLKAGMVGAAALLGAWASLREWGPARAPWGAASTALTANALNQLDTRPGRAGAAFLVGMGWLALRAHPARRWRLLAYLPLAAAVAAYLPYDTAEQAMLGDAGANALGAALGAAAADMLDSRRLIRWVLVAAATNAALDMVSLNGVLDRLQDQLQRLALPGRKLLAARRMEAAPTVGATRLQVPSP